MNFSAEPGGHLANELLLASRKRPIGWAQSRILRCHYQSNTSTSCCKGIHDHRHGQIAQQHARHDLTDLYKCEVAADIGSMCILYIYICLYIVVEGYIVASSQLWRSKW